MEIGEEEEEKKLLRVNKKRQCRRNSFGRSQKQGARGWNEKNVCLILLEDLFL